jgi:hypothetical protein
LTWILQINTSLRGDITGSIAVDEVIRNNGENRSCTELAERKGNRVVSPLTNASFNGRSLRFTLQYGRQAVPVQLQLVDETFVWAVPDAAPIVFQRMK